MKLKERAREREGDRKIKIGSERGDWNDDDESERKQEKNYKKEK